MKTHSIIQALVLSVTLLWRLPCVAQSGGHFLRHFGSATVVDSQNQVIDQVIVEATEVEDKRSSVAVTWKPMSHGKKVVVSKTKPLAREGWFVFVEDTSRVWVFDGNELSLLHYNGKSLTDSLLAELKTTCPKEVRDALPENFRKKHSL
jgi:hypothetical protein